MNAWLAVALAGIGSFVFRAAIVLLVGRVTIPAWFERVSGYVTPAVFASLAAGGLLEPLTRDAGAAAPVLAGAAVTVVVARRSAAMAAAAGMTTLWATTAVAAVL